MASKAWAITAAKFLTEEHVERLLSVLRTNKELAESGRLRQQSITDYFIVRILLGTGLRVAEFTNLIVGDFNGSNLNIRCGKGGKPRTVLLTSDTQAILQEWITYKARIGHRCDDNAILFQNPRGDRLTTRAIQNRVKLAYASANLPGNFTTHSLRHTYCSFLLKQKGVSLATVKANLGHASISTTNLYSHAIGSLDGVDLLSRRKSSSFTQKYEDSIDSEQLLSLLKTLLGSANFRKSA